MGISRDHYNVGKIGNVFFLKELLRDLANLNGVPLLQGSLYSMGNNNIFVGALVRSGKISMEFLHLGEVYEGITVRFGKISMEFLHLGGFMRNNCEIWENLNGVPSLEGFTRESNSCLKGAGDEYSHGTMRSTVWDINWRKLTHGLMGLCRADLGKSEEK